MPMTVQPSRANARARIAGLLAGRTSRPAFLTEAVSSLTSAWGLAAINPDTFGFLGSVRTDADVSISSGSNVLTSPNAPWTAADVGKSIDVQGAGVAGGTLSTTISAFTNAGQVTLSANASTTVSAGAASTAGISAWGTPSPVQVSSSPLTNPDGSTVFEPTDLNLDNMQAAAFVTPGSSTSRTIGQRAQEVFNVKDYGAKGDGTTDDTVAIQAAANALPATQQAGVLYFPAGHYLVSSAITITAKGASIRGQGRTASVFRPATNGAYWVLDLDAQNVSGMSFDVADIGVRESGSMNLVGALRIKRAYAPKVRNFNADIGGNCLWIEECSPVSISDCCLTSFSSTPIRLRQVGGTMTGVNAHYATNTTFGQSGRGENGPCVWISGTTVALMVSGSTFQGGGGRDVKLLSSISSNGSSFTVTLPTAHNIVAGEHVFIDECLVSAYNGLWKVDSVGANTITILSSLNPGAAASGKCGRTRACVYFDASEGPVNETLWAGCLFEGWYTAREVGSASIHIDGKFAPTANGCINHTFSGCYFDYGQTGILIHGKKVSSDWTVRGIVVSGGVVQFAKNGVYIQCAQRCSFGGGVAVTGQVSFAPTSDQLQSSAIRVDSTGGGVENSERLSFLGVNAGPSVFNSSTFDPDYGLRLDGTAIDRIHINGCTIHGNIAPFLQTAGNVLDSGKKVVIKGNLLNETLAVTTVASASTITPGLDEVINLTGSVTVDTINNAWNGRELTVYIADGVTFSTAGNIAVGGAFSVGSTKRIVFLGGKWRIQ